MSGRANFDRVARPYEAMERIAFGGALHRARVAHLEAARDARNVLIVGEGDGRFLGALRAVNPVAEVTVMDLSRAMLSLAGARDRSGRTVFVHADITRAELPAAAYDLVVTHFVLDCFEQETCDAVVAKLAKAATGEARWLLADFHLPASGVRRAHAAVWLWTMYRFFRLAARLRTTDLADPLPQLILQEFEVRACSRSRWGLIQSLWLERGRATD
jgi:ubiquinone/menaquinone biosynthesis C-methylase UbiE